MTIYSLDVLLSQQPVCCSMSGSNCCFLTCTFLRRQVRWSDIPISLRIFHILLWFTQQNKTKLLDIQAGFRKGRGTRDQIANICCIIEKAREFQEKHLLLLYWLCQSLWLCGSQQTVENSERDGNTKSLDLPSEKSVSRSRGKLEPDMEQQTGSK